MSVDLLRKSLIMSIVFVLLINVLSITTFAKNKIVVKTPSQDTYATKTDGKNSVSTYSHLQITNTSLAYVSFDLSDIKSINNKAILTLNMYQRLPEAQTAKLGIYGVDNQDWDVNTLTGATLPNIKERIEQITLTLNVTAEIDVTRYVRKYKSRRGNISFALMVDDGSGCTVNLRASESSRGPTLILDRDSYDETLYGGPEPTPESTPTPTPASKSTPEPTATPIPPREEREYYVPPADTSVLPDNINIDSLTTTRTAPWMVNYHMTTIEQAAAGYAGGECGQAMACVDISPSNSDYMATGHDTCTVWVSDNGGKNWLNKADGLGLMGVIDIRFDPDDSNTIYLIGHPFIDNVSKKHKFIGVWKTIDGAKSWKQVSNFKFTKGFAQWLIDFSEPDHTGERCIYIGTDEGVMCSNDSGITWKCIGLESVSITSLQVVDGNIIVTGRDGKAYIREQLSEEWQQRSEGLGEKPLNSIAVDPHNYLHWFVTDSSNLYETNNAGRIWKVKHTKSDMGINGSFSGVHFNNPKAGEPAVLYIQFEANSPNFYYSMNYGENFQKPSFINKDISFMKDNWGWWAEAFRPFPNSWNEIMVSIDGELHYGKIENGALNLIASASGISGLRAAAIAFDPTNANEMYFGTVDRGVVKMIDSGKEENYPLGYFMPFEDRYNIRWGGAKTVNAIGIDPRNSQRLICWVGSWYNGVLKESLNGGLSWVEIPNTQCNAVCIQFNKNNPDIIYAGRLISYDNGKTWTKSQYGIRTVSNLNNDIVYGVGAEQIYVSYNCGVDWELLSSTKVPGIQNINVDLFEEGKIYAGSFQSGMYIITKDSTEHITTENGMTKSESGNLAIFDIAQNPKNKEHLLAGGVDNYNGAVSGGLFESRDGGKNWYVIEGITGSKDIWHIVFHPLKPVAYVTTSQGTFAYEYENWFDRSKYYFKDVKDGNLYIDTLAKESVVDGYADGSYRPENNLTRAEFAKLISQFIKGDNVKINFSDVSENLWCYKYISTVAANGIMIGEDGKFRPDDNITHEEAMNVLARLMSANGVNSNYDLSEASNAFIDDNISPYAIHGVYKCFHEKIFARSDENFIFNPKSELTRGEVAVLLYRVRKVI